MVTSNYHKIIDKLDTFINKYYKNLIIKGFLYLFLFSLSLFILLAIIEYFGHFNSTTRTIIFYSYIFLFLILIIRFIFIPIMGLLRISKHLNHQQASKIIGIYFPEINDKLSNILQLSKIENISSEQQQLIEAGIEQKSKNIHTFPILNVIDFKSNYRYAKYLLIPIGVILITWVSKPELVEEPSNRLFLFQKEFEKAQAFHISIVNNDLLSYEKENFDLEVEIIGNELPEKLYIHYRSSRFLMEKRSGNRFSHSFKNLRKSIDFFISDEVGFNSEQYKLTVYPKAKFNGFQIKISPPKYTLIPEETHQNIGDIVVPIGSVVQWKIKTSNCNQIHVFKDKKNVKIEAISNNELLFSDTIINNAGYKIYSSNEYIKNSDSIGWIVQAIKDEYPEIRMEVIADSNNKDLLYFNGFIDDDYGFSSLQMIIEDKVKTIIPIHIKAYSRPQRFFHFINMKDLNVAKGSDIAYYFKVYDNDEWNGYKSSKSSKEFFHFSSMEELVEDRNKNADSLKTDLRESLMELQTLHKEIKDFKKELVNKELLSWDDKKKMEDLLKQQEELQKKVENYQKQNEEINSKSNDIQQNERILEKQEQLQDLFEQVMDEETKEKMAELRKMLEEMNKENSQDVLEKLEMSAQELEEQLDRNLEIFKQLEFEMQLEENIEELKELAKKQDSLAEETKNAEKNQSENLEKKQDSLNKEFEKIKENIEKLDSLNNELKEPNEFDNKKEEQQKIDSLQKNAQDDLQNKMNEKASDNQKEAADEMNKMAAEMQAQMDENEEEGVAEDMEALRGILDRLIKLSFTQEALIDSLGIMGEMDPKYNYLVQKQFGMEEKFQSVKDSLKALAQRQPMIQGFVIKELNKIEFRLESTTNNIENHKTNDALRDQQFVMKSFNQLALMLDESLKQMQQMMQSMMEGEGAKKKSSCNKPGTGKPSPNSMKSLQKQLNEQMKALKKQQKEGKKPGSKGNKGKGMSEQFARMAAEQARIRRMMQDYQEQMLNEYGEKPGGLDDALKDMEKTEHDLVNKIINSETLKRQQNIMTRLLKSEKAERKREKDKKRKSNEGKNVKRGNPNEYFQYKDNEERELNLMKTIPLDMNRFYKTKVDMYFYKFDNTKKDVEKE